MSLLQLEKVIGVPGWLSWWSVWLLILAQVMISRLAALSPRSGSVLTALSLIGILSLPLSALPPTILSLSLSLSLKINKHLKKEKEGRLCGSVGWAYDFSSDHDLTVCGFKPCIRLCADSLLKACSLLQILCLLLSLCPSPTRARSLSLKNK